MNPFSYSRVTDAADAISRVRDGRGARCIAGGTDLLQLLQERVEDADELLDLNDLPIRGISSSIDGIHIGALTTLADVADDPTVRDQLPVVAEALGETASPQVRNMATMGGNLLQRTRCPYFRDRAVPCNKRDPGTGCPAIDGQNRMHAIFGGSEHCIAVQPSDLAVALVALDAEILVSSGTERSIKVEDLYRLPGETPHVDTVLDPGEIITAIVIPASATKLRSRYFKVRDRASFEWALASAAVAIDVDPDGRVQDLRIAVGGVATKPWRLRNVEAALANRVLDAEAIFEARGLAAGGAESHGRNAYKVPMLQGIVARALSVVGERT
ncbi:xanthine dehydrogenase family protein subunit M [Fodinicurvata sp. EGI_FJ10296]|uniref:FAD binding domain-containing protein n=1 Tax=Fodinicurvata sp. EGI_FJ10296 TaxID=3231908 RepID=UPI003455CBCC